MTHNSNTSFSNSKTRRWTGLALTLLVNIGLFVIINGLFSVDVTILQSGVLS
jgi:hypothetical protein